ncbi:hypothetical protein CK1_25620 [Ruminococcus sp. SR1/5]|nr:hypothetical protein CK1_25620 [Ruminococcus sp. SR1/5]
MMKGGVEVDQVKIGNFLKNFAKKKALHRSSWQKY